MIETTVILKPRERWRRVPRYGSFLPFLKRPLSFEELTAEMDAKMRFPGVSNAWTMPIKARIDMLTTGVRTPVGIKIFGSDLQEIERIGEEIERALQDVPGTRSVFAERTGEGFFLDFDLRREPLARYGLSVEEVEMAIMSAIGRENVAYTVEGRARYPIQVRYPRELRGDLDQLRRILVAAPGGGQVPLGTLAEIKLVRGPAMIRDENGLLAGYVYVDAVGRDIGGYVKEAKRAVREKVPLPPGYSISWSGQYEYMERVADRLRVFVPLALGIIFFLYYLTFRSAPSALIIMLAMPFAAIGGVWGIRLLGFNLSIAVWAGMIEVTGIGAALCALVLTFLSESLERWRAEGRVSSRADLLAAATEGASRALRPVLMTCSADILGLLPALWASGIGAEFLKRYTAPIIFGLFSAVALSLLALPVIFIAWKSRSLNLSGN